MKLTLSLLALPLLLGACPGGGSDDGSDDGGGSDAYFRAKVEGVLWEADAEHINAVVGDVGVGLQVTIAGSQEATQEHFTIIVPEFSGDVSLACDSTAGVIVRYTGAGDAWECDAGTLDIALDDSADVHVYTGTFSGSFPNPTDTGLKQITEGEFWAERLL